MKKYILVRILRSILSLCVVVAIAFAMVYTMIPRVGVFKSDPTYSKLASEDAVISYTNGVYEQLGYLTFYEQKEICKLVDDDGVITYDACMTGNDALKDKAAELEKDGFTVGQYESSGFYYAIKERPLMQRIIGWFTSILYWDHPWRVQDVENPDIPRKYYIAKGPNGIPAIACSGCTSKYQLYVDSKFPFLHENFLEIDMGYSYPQYSGTKVLDVISQGQGETVKSDITYPTGNKANSSLDLYSCQYKATLDSLDKKNFTDNYALCKSVYSDPSMIGTSSLMGIFSLILSYLVAIPVGISMASHKDKFADKLGMAYIIFMIAVPSLAYIYAFKFIGAVFFGLPDKFPMLGAHNWKSYILPIISLSLPSIGSLMMWIRRYLVDQSTADYVKFARAKGLSQREIFITHIFKNASIPLIHGIPGSIIGVIGGALITEAVYAVPGMGKMLPDAILKFNNPMIIALTFIFTGISIFSILAGDILITYVDPRISLADDGGRK